MRIGLIGAGAVADLHAMAADRLGDTRLTAVCDLREDAAERVAGPYGAATFTDYRDLLACGAVDAVVVNTPHALHSRMVLDAAEAGLHVLVEKPMATTLEDCDLMAEACARAGVTLTVGHIQHFLPDKRAAETAIAGGALGAPVAVHDYRSTDYRPGTRSPWFFSRELAGGGALMNIGAHCLDRSVWLAGSDAVSLTAATTERFGAPVETDGSVALGLASGALATVSVMSDTPRKVDELTVVCERGTVVADPRAGTFVRVDGRTRQVHTPRPSDIPDAFYAQLADFAAVVGGAVPRVSLAHGRHVVEMVLAAYASATAGGPVAVGAARQSV
ncbi:MULTISPECIES: Gfo/Idh/MocA family protein [unclassified Streptomyces]|uniref:Gfo/Idh/MocA family protein n=1 Tax=unclassified Streptomyces TaxID=2593676 RepID=UPI002E2CA0FF|nr:Gfo/Idh/MocA family oxidoreductase [Streptomyces sp. NBC_00223]